MCRCVQIEQPLSLSRLIAALAYSLSLPLPPPAFVQDVFRSIDTDGSDSLDAAEFVSWLTQIGVPQKLDLPPERVRRTLLDVFQEMDVDRNGSLSFKEVNRYLRHGRHAVLLDTNLRDGAVKVQPGLQQSREKARTSEGAEETIARGNKPARPSGAPPAGKSREKSARPASAPMSPFGMLPLPTTANVPALRGMNHVRPKTAGPAKGMKASGSATFAASPSGHKSHAERGAELLWMSKHAYGGF